MDTSLAFVIPSEKVLSSSFLHCIDSRSQNIYYIYAFLLAVILAVPRATSMMLFLGTFRERGIIESNKQINNTSFNNTGRTNPIPLSGRHQQHERVDENHILPKALSLFSSPSKALIYKGGQQTTSPRFLRSFDASKDAGNCRKNRNETTKTRFVAFRLLWISDTQRRRRPSSSLLTHPLTQSLGPVCRWHKEASRLCAGLALPPDVSHPRALPGPRVLVFEVDKARFQRRAGSLGRALVGEASFECPPYSAIDFAPSRFCRLLGGEDDSLPGPVLGRSRFRVPRPSPT